MIPEHLSAQFDESVGAGLHPNFSVGPGSGAGSRGRVHGEDFGGTFFGVGDACQQPALFIRQCVTEHDEIEIDCGCQSGCLGKADGAFD